MFGVDGEAVILPLDLVEDNRLKDLLPGESGWTVPWAMAVINDRCYLNGNYDYHEHPGGTVEMKVEHRRDGYHVFVRTTGYKYSSCDDPPWNGTSQEDLIPVVGIH